MATVTAIAFNLFETIGLVPPCFEVVVREPEECAADSKALRIQWVHDIDVTGRKVIRIQWIEDKQHEGTAYSARI
jgi:hypothetical protein